MRKFHTEKATRIPTTLRIGIVGPSGAGKTYSALRLATGIKNKVGGEIFLIDTENKRSSHYGDEFKFTRLDFEPPFGPKDYTLAIEQCISEGARIVVIDSMTHEHEGEGGILSMHEAEEARGKRGISSWIMPKSERKKLNSFMNRTDVHFILCFHAKEKTDFEARPPKYLGFHPVGGSEYVYDMTVRALLLPNSEGVPVWRSDLQAENSLIKIPNYMAWLKSCGQLDEKAGERMAMWALGTKPPTFDELVAMAGSGIELEDWKHNARDIWSKLEKEQKEKIKEIEREWKQ